MIFSGNRHIEQSLSFFTNYFNVQLNMEDTTCSLCPYFKIHDGKIQEWKANCEKFYELTKTESNMVYYGFSFAENGQAFCREAYKSGAGLLNHLQNVDAPLKAALKISDLVRLEFHGPASEVEVVREALTPLGCLFFTLDGKGIKNWITICINVLVLKASYHSQSHMNKIKNNKRKINLLVNVHKYILFLD